MPDKKNKSKQSAHRFEITTSLEYLLFLPQDYEEGSGSRWPLILFLHGAGERGDDLEKVKVYGIPKIVEDRPDFPFIVVSPQCPADTWWGDHHLALKGLLDEIVSTYAVDAARLYLTGLSMGGYGTWALAQAYPDTFAAAAPICGGGMPDRIGVLKSLPVWAFHGADDPTVPLEHGQHMVDALRAAGGEVTLTVYPGVGHDSWTQTYENPELYEWFLEHERG